MFHGHLGRVSPTKYQIDLTELGKTHINQDPYRGTLRRLETEGTKADKMLVGSIIEPSSRERSPKILFLQKKDGSLRFCVDFRI